MSTDVFYLHAFSICLLVDGQQKRVLNLPILLLCFVFSGVNLEIIVV